MSVLPATVLEAWQATPDGDDGVLVLPDGCRDLVARLQGDGRVRWYVSDLFDVALEATAGPGDRFLGWRLHPAAVIDTERLIHAVSQRASLDNDDVARLLGDNVRLDHRLADVLAGLAMTCRVGDAARSLGASPRTLERMTSAGTGRRPAYWKSLARVRRAAAALDDTRITLADLAAEHGFADQAHMTREFRAWFGLSPRRFRDRRDLVTQVRAPGYR